MVTAGVDGAIFLFEIEGLAGSDAPLITQDDDFVMISQGEVPCSGTHVHHARHRDERASNA
eukprot:109766-Amphidinium_carterae.2